MVPAPTMHASYSQQSLTSSALELKYANSSHLVDIISKDEDMRRLRFDIHILEDDNDEVRGMLIQEQDRSDAFEKLVNENLTRAEEAEAQCQVLEGDLRGREQECQALRAEKSALQHSSEDVTAALTEKLALTRELSLLKPELEHLKAQAASAEALMTDKLALQRQLTEIQCEVENAKREAKRALAKRRNTGVEIAQEEQLDDLRRQLTKEKRMRQRAEEAAQSADGGDAAQDDMRKQLAKERKARQKAEEQLQSAQDTTQVEDVRKDLLKEKKVKAKLEESLESLQAELEQEKKAAAAAAKRADGNAQADDEAEELRSELAKEKKDRVKAQKATQQAAAEYEAQKATLDDKLNQFRTKLKSTKEKLKETEAELTAAREAAAAAPAKLTAAAPKAAAAAKANPKKRNANQMDPDATTLGTPGDGPVAKRGRKAVAGVGDKSTFSITPFLNKTTSMIQDDDAAQEEASEEEEEAYSPAIPKKTKQPLAEQPASKSNVPHKKPAAAQRKPKQALEVLTEEDEDDIHKQGQENVVPTKPAAKEQTLKIKTKTSDGPADPSDPKKQKKRKSLADFASFNPEPEVEKKQKKRKLGGLGKTLFDEEEAAPEVAPARGGVVAKRALFGTKGFGGGLLGAKKAGGGSSSFLGGSRAGGTTMLTAAGDGSGFCFSPLKKARRNLDDTLRG
ncbi:hypothetical protein LTR37_017306 [Vermiconidia calcicola]|uniref:Uncharacterized protein n=1 Tax=Vermiconidia calcicola TaxID=1690605 RepID=A0ACC3MLC8_9PEZI|nr:hypothetical protein LTR37_017306 [Vermiconidia calcicola]